MEKKCYNCQNQKNGMSPMNSPLCKKCLGKTNNILPYTVCPECTYDYKQFCSNCNLGSNFRKKEKPITSEIKPRVPFTTKVRTIVPRTKIEYADMGTKIKMLKFKNILTLHEINKLIGSRNYSEWLSTSPRYYKVHGHIVIHFEYTEIKYTVPIKVNVMYDRQKFFGLTNQMKIAGENFSKLLKKISAPKTETILI